MSLTLSDEDALRFISLQFEVCRNGYLLCTTGDSVPILRLSQVAYEASLALQQGLTIGETQLIVAQSVGETVDFRPLIATLIAHGVAWPAQWDGPLWRRKKSRRIPEPLVRRVFCWQSAVILGLMILWASLILFSLPVSRFHVHPFLPIHRLSFGFIALAIVTTSIHELAHAGAASAIGVGSRFKVGMRFLFPVLLTDLSELRSVERSRRYLPFAAGMLSDCAICAATVIVMGFIKPNTSTVMTCRALFSLSCATLIWQCCFFLRTDVYFLLVTAMDRDELERSAIRILGAAFKSRDFRIFRDDLVASIYALAVSVGYVALIAVGIFYLEHLKDWNPQVREHPAVAMISIAVVISGLLLGNSLAKKWSAVPHVTVRFA